METQAALVGADSGVELHAETTVHLHLAVVVNPRHTEHDLAFRLNQALKKTGLLILGVLFKHSLQRMENLGYSLMKLRLTRVFCNNFFQLFAYVGHDCLPPAQN